MNRLGVIGIGIILGVLVLAASVQALEVSSYNIEPTPTSPGQEFTLTAYVTNNNSLPAQNVVFELILGEDSTDTSFPFSIEPTDSFTRSLGTIPQFQTVQVKYRILVDPQALDGLYELTLIAIENGAAGATTNAVVEITSREPLLSIVNVTPSSVQTGESVFLALTIKNTGNTPVSDVILRLIEDRTVTSTGTIVERDIVPLGASSLYLSALGVGDTSTFNLPLSINPSATSKTYFVPVSLEFFDSNQARHTFTDYIGLKVIAQPNLELIVAETEPLLVPGGHSRLTFDLFNDGLGPAKFVQARVDSDFFSIPTRDFFIGTIESDDFDSLVLDGTVSSSLSPGEHPVNVTISYKNEFGDPVSETKTVNVRVYAPNEVPSANGESGFPLWIIILILVIGIGYWWFKIRKPKNGK